MHGFDSMEQIDAMRQGVDYSFNVSIRGFNITLRPLSVYEIVRLTADIAGEMKGIPEAGRNRLTEHTLLAKKTIVLASTTGVNSNDPKITEMVLERFTTDELHTLFKAYQNGCDRVNPVLELLNDTQVKEIVETLKKSQVEPEELVLALTELSFSQLLSMAKFLVTNGN